MVVPSEPKYLSKSFHPKTIFARPYVGYVVVVVGAGEEGLYKWVYDNLDVVDDITGACFACVLPCAPGVVGPPFFRIAGVVSEDMQNLRDARNVSIAEELAQAWGIQGKTPCLLAYDYADSAYSLIPIDAQSPDSLLGLLRASFRRSLSGEHGVVSTCLALRRANREMLANGSTADARQLARLSLEDLTARFHKSKCPPFRKHLEKERRNRRALGFLTGPFRFLVELGKRWASKKVEA